MSREPPRGREQGERPMEIDEKIGELETQLAQLRQRRLDERRALMESVIPQFRYTLELVIRPHDRVADPSCEWYRLEGKVTNREELEAVGRTVHEGGMDYLFNRLSGRFVLSSGGQVFLNLTDGTFGKADRQAFDELEAVVRKNPGVGGDVTDIVNRARALREGS